MAQREHIEQLSTQGKDPPMSNPRGLQVFNETANHASHDVLTCGVGGGISALMIAVNGDIQSEVFRQILVRAITHECGIITDEIHISVDGRCHSATLVYVPVNASCEGG
jgi:hypothetical protein